MKIWVDPFFRKLFHVFMVATLAILVVAFEVHRMVPKPQTPNAVSGGTEHASR